ncbi:MAG: hypothetical protein K2K52_08555, partial [Paramuribaculum sp.]|nr:hypothetical protein [Paramuribaculum sp.]
MSLNSFLSKIFGNKSQRDLKEIRPIVDSIIALAPELKQLSNDELRDKINTVRADIKNAIAEDEKAISEKKEQIETLP